ncbi:MAG: PilT/PilU family type 4a pilus ATPase [Bradymonadia bacterium]
MQALSRSNYEKEVSSALSSSALFHGLSPDQIGEVAAHGSLYRYTVGQCLARQGDPSEAFDIFVRGNAVVRREESAGHGTGTVELARLSPPDAAGEMGVLLETPRSASILAIDDEVIVIRFTKAQFDKMMQNLPFFGLVLSRTLASRLHAINRQVSLPRYSGSVDSIDDATLSLVPFEFRAHHQVLPIGVEQHHLTVGFVEEPTDQLLGRLQRLLPGMVVRPVHIEYELFSAAMKRDQHSSDGTVNVRLESAALGPLSDEIDLEHLLRRVIAEGASDLHLSAKQTPRWRIDGRLIPLSAQPRLSSKAILAAMEAIMPAPRRKEFEESNDTDFAYPLGGDARFRVNVFHDINGVGAVLRHIPSLIRTPEQLGLPTVITEFCRQPHGLVLVTGPTGSGKSTTLAAMIDLINRSRSEHIITLEDPVEFVHQSNRSLVNQREVGSHTHSFASALRAALREDPDVVLVGELRDLETIRLAIETAQTGHLVFATLHTSTAIGTIERIVGMFPPEQQGQVRLSLSEVLKGVVAQTLLPKKTGGRVAAFEILVSNHAVANLIREAKSSQLMSVMEVGRKAGNALLNDELVRLVRDQVVDRDVAFERAVHKDDFKKRLGWR